VPSTFLPRLGRFLDINDPLTLVPVSPNDFAAKFGAGIELKRVTLELTDDPVTPPPESWPQPLKEKGRMPHQLMGWPDTPNETVGLHRNQPSFATISALLGHAAVVAPCPLLRAERKTYAPVEFFWF
jgi:hypothetical protein